MLDGITLDIIPGQRLAVVGATGSGKSTLVTLIPGMRPPCEGRVTLDGSPTSDLALPAADGRRRIGLVTQEHHLFRGTLADDVRLACPEASVREVGDVLAAVGASGWTDRLPDGVDTLVGKGGVQLIVRRSSKSLSPESCCWSRRWWCWTRRALRAAVTPRRSSTEQLWP
ncbi:ATP-binding cassette domain-containing protein [Streptomyces fagopyri]|uniref:ATP-binding cassette domain-containing protein n=1 Tax=Streptomyces fagopyri TaxID=2662397 RepID=UPI00367A87DD